MKIAFILLAILLTIHTSESFWFSSKKVNVEKTTNFVNGKWIEETVKTTVITGKDGSETTTTETTSREVSPPNGKQNSETPKSASKTVSKPASRPRSRTRKRSRTSSPKKVSDEAIKKDVLNEINKFRRNHGVRPLKMNDKLSNKAQKFAQKLARSSSPELRLNNAKDIGQNIFYRTSSREVKIKGKDAVDYWYKEENDYNYFIEPTVGALKHGHFTQMVWKDTTDLGVGVAYARDRRKCFVVTFYSPKGNWVGEFSEQVFPKSDRPLKDEELKSAKKPISETEYMKRFLEAHNKYRKKHHASPLVYDKNLNERAQAWANKLAKDDKMYHSSNDNYGENLYYAWSSKPGFKPLPEDAVKNWYDEIKMYTYGLEKHNHETGHFTQLIWKKSRKLGFGIAKSKTGSYYVVAKYDPPGNYMNEYTDNVLNP